MFGATETMALVLAKERKRSDCTKGLETWCNLEYPTVVRHG